MEYIDNHMTVEQITWSLEYIEDKFKVDNLRQVLLRDYHILRSAQGGTENDHKVRQEDANKIKSALTGFKDTNEEIRLTKLEEKRKLQEMMRDKGLNLL